MKQLATLQSRALIGLQAPLVRIEVHITNGLPAFSMVGLPEKAVRESKERVRSALLSSQFQFPNRRITVNLAPAEFPKQGSRFDLAIALGVLIATQQLICEDMGQYECIGELALSGHLQPVYGALSTALAATKAKRSLILPKENAPIAALVEGSHILPAQHLLEIHQHLSSKVDKRPLIAYCATQQEKKKRVAEQVNLSDIRGQPKAKRALEIAAAGQHNLLMIGPPGSGKSMLAHCLPSLLPNLTQTQACETLSIYALRYKITERREHPPFRQPHHSSSMQALIGGGTPIQPGEISLAHHGVLFLDEFAEFGKPALEALREPMEQSEITIARCGHCATFPSNFQLIAAMNPCPCGYYHTDKACTCRPQRIRSYQEKLSGPLCDRFELHIHVPTPALSQLIRPTHPTESSLTVKKRILKARARQRKRQQQSNATLTNRQLTAILQFSDETQTLIEQVIATQPLSPRKYYKGLKVAQTIADLAESSVIQPQHLTEALELASAANLEEGI